MSFADAGMTNFRGRLKNAYELLYLRVPEISMFDKNCIFEWMGKVFCVEFQRVPLKFHTKYLTHTFRDVYLVFRWKFKSSLVQELIGVFETPPDPVYM